MIDTWYRCPVCDYARLPVPPRDYLICPSCGTEFGVDDVAQSYDDLRRAWQAAGSPWFSRHTSPPIDRIDTIGRLLHLIVGLLFGLRRNIC